MSRNFRQKPEFVVNPNTNRQIRKGGKAWLKLVKNGVLERDGYLPPNCAYKLKEAEYENEEAQMEKLQEEKQRMIDNDEVPDGVHPVISKKNQIVYQKPKLTAQETSELTSQAAMDVIDQIQSGELELPDMNRDDARDYLQKLIFEQMLSSKKKFRNTRLEPKKIKKLPKGLEPLLRRNTRMDKYKKPDNNRRMVKMKPLERSYSRIDRDRVLVDKPKVEKKEPVYADYYEEEPEEEQPDSESEYEYVYEEVEE